MCGYLAAGTPPARVQQVHGAGIAPTPAPQPPSCWGCTPPAAAGEVQGLAASLALPTFGCPAVVDTREGAKASAVSR